MPENKKSSVGAFASFVSAQEKYILFNIDCLDHDNAEDKPRGASRFLPRVACHELLHTLGFDHPRTPTQPGEGSDLRSIEQVRNDIASTVSSVTALGRLDKESGRHVITYSFGGNPARIAMGHGIVVEGVRHLWDTQDDVKNQQNAQIQSAMKEAFAEISSLTNIVFQESLDPNSANVRIFAGTVAASTDSAVSLDGDRNPLTDRSTIMSYNIAEPDRQLDDKSLQRGIFKILAPGDLYALQKIYGLPPEDANRRIITPERMVANSSVFWDHQKMAIKLTEAPKLGAIAFDEGALNIDMGAHPFTPAITGSLKDKDGKEWRVSQQIASGAFIDEMDANGSNIKLEITGTLGARITPNKDAIVNLNRRNNTLMLGAGGDTITFLKGFGNIATNLSPDDTITAKDAKKVQLQYWSEREVGTLMTFIGDDGTKKGSLFVKDRKPEELEKQMKGLSVVEARSVEQDAPVLSLKEEKDYDITLAGTPRDINYGEAQGVIVTAKKASGFTMRNYSGPIVVKMTKAEYESRAVSAVDSDNYAVSFSDGDKIQKFKVQKNARFAITDDDGKVASVVSIQEILNAIDKDAEMENAPPVMSFKEEKDVLVSAPRAAGHSIANMGGGNVVIKMTLPQYESRTITRIPNGYQLSFRDADGIKNINLQDSAKIVITDPDGKTGRLLSIKDALKEFDLDLALKKGFKESSLDSMLAKLPLKMQKYSERTV